MKLTELDAELPPVFVQDLACGQLFVADFSGKKTLALVHSIEGCRAERKVVCYRVGGEGTKRLFLYPEEEVIPVDLVDVNYVRRES